MYTFKIYVSINICYMYCDCTQKERWIPNA